MNDEKNQDGAGTGTMAVSEFQQNYVSGGGVKYN